MSTASVKLPVSNLPLLFSRLDFSSDEANRYGGKIRRYERQLHHYGSGLNSLPLFSDFQSNPTPSNLYTLRVAYGGTFGPLTNIDEEGFASAAFHSFPNTLRWDPYSGDYGPNFLGMTLGHTTYLVLDSNHQYQAFDGNIQSLGQHSKQSEVIVESRDAVRRRVFIAPLGLKIELSAGVISSFTYNALQRSVALVVAAAAPVNGAVSAENTIIWLSTPAGQDMAFHVTGSRQMMRGGTHIKLNRGSTTHVMIRPAE